MQEIDIKSGDVKDIYDSRDYKYSDIGKSSKPFDWSVGYDIETLLGHKITPKDQGQSSSCGGQAFSYYGSVLEEMTNGDVGERSAKFLYSQVYCPGGGSRPRDLCEIAVNQGFGFESGCPSYENGKPGSEEFMTRSQDITPQSRKEASNDKGLVYASVNCNIDSIAQAVRDNYGAVILVNGQNGKGWFTTYPQPTESRDWGHFIYAGKAKLINGKRHIGILNSWGNIGENGWQWLSEDFFTALGGYGAYDAKTIVVKKNNDGLIRRILIMIIERLLKGRK